MANNSSADRRSADLSGGERQLSLAERRQRRVAALRHGLFARAAPNLRGHAHRYGRLAAKLYEHAPDLTALDEATVRAWARAETRAVDCFARLEEDPTNGKLAEMWHQAESLAARRRAELFLTPASRLDAARVASSFQAEDVEAAQARIRASLEAPA